MNQSIEINQLSSENDISPSLFPTLSAWFLLGLSLVLITLNGLKLRNRDFRNLDKAFILILLEAIICLITAAAIYLLLPLAGFLILDFLLVVFLI